ncbi:MAG: hypothetical protein KBT22_01355 [Bacteroidales bacterium]|nr:hypothetical protein [Candidatus Scybalocola fimicaballi]
MIKELQQQAINFLSNKFIVVNGVKIYPKEIEVYYFKKGVYEDNSVHQNELQQNHHNRLYIHRWGKTKNDPYKGGNYPGIDFVISDEESCFHTFLLRSVVINGELITGPHKVLEAIKVASKSANYQELEDMPIEIGNEGKLHDILLSERINLGKTVKEEYLHAPLRFVVLDGNFCNSKYPLKEKLISDWLLSKLNNKQISKEDAIDIARENLGYLPSSIKITK